MKKVEKQRTTTYEMWQATDGTEFSSKEECQKYEESAKGVLRERFKKLVVAEENAWDLLYGYEDNTVYAVKLETTEDVETLLQLYILENPHITGEQYKDYLAKYTAMATSARCNNDLLLMGENCEGDLYFMNTRNAIIGKLEHLGEKEDKDAQV